MKAAIYNPYLDTLGGGELYTISIAKILKETGYDVDLQWRSEKILYDLGERFDLSLTGINIVSDLKRGEGYDICFWVSDGSIPLLRSRKNLIHFQVPFKNVGGKNLLTKMKLFRINKILCNSNFTKSIIDKEFNVSSVVLYPPVMVDQMVPRVRKEKILLYVARFSNLLQSKRQDILIKVFKSMYDKGLKDWRLILAGGVEIGAEKYVTSLERLKSDYPVSIIKKPPRKELIKLYSRSSIFWSAAGYGENENIRPEKVEHFGIAVVEAMASGCVPLVFDAGGHKEIVRGGCGRLWTTLGELKRYTKELIADKNMLKECSRQAINQSENYSLEKFRDSFLQLI